MFRVIQPAHWAGVFAPAMQAMVCGACAQPKDCCEQGSCRQASAEDYEHARKIGAA